MPRLTFTLRRYKVLVRNTAGSFKPRRTLLGTSRMDVERQVCRFLGVKYLPRYVKLCLVAGPVPSRARVRWIEEQEVR